MEYEGIEEDSAHIPTAKGELFSAGYFEKLDEDVSLFLRTPTGLTQHKLSSAPAGPTKLRVSCIPRIPSQPPATSSRINQFLSPTSAYSI